LRLCHHGPLHAGFVFRAGLRGAGQHAAADLVCPQRVGPAPAAAVHPERNRIDTEAVMKPALDVSPAEGLGV